MINVFCIGELLIDFICMDIGKNLRNGINFEKKAGGAPANVAAAVSKLGGKSYFLGQVGADSFGKFLMKTLEDVNINTSMTVEKGKTTLAFVAIDEKGERDFEFHRGSDGEFDLTNVDLSIIKDQDIIHFGSATGFLEGRLKESYFKLLEYGKENDVFISFDPNYRDALIEDLDEFISCSKEFIIKSDFVKLSLEELKLITGQEDLNKGIDIIHTYGGKVVAITLGDAGTLLSFNDNREIIPSIEITQVDSTGAGDAFVGGVLKKLSEIEDKKSIEFSKWKEIIRYGNLVGAITCSNYGAIDAMPSRGFEKNINNT